MGSHKPYRNALFLLIILVLSACSGYKHRYQQSSIQLERTPCFGECPVYTLTIMGNGNAVLDNRKFTEYTGEFKRKIKPEEVNELFKELSCMDWEGYQDEYPTSYSDLPGAVLTFKHKKINKRINIPGGAEIPDELRMIIVKMEDLRESDNWQGETQ